jgi:arylsulfatase A-like enzyme
MSERAPNFGEKMHMKNTLRTITAFGCLGIAALGFLGVNPRAGDASAASAKTQPNVIVILADDLGYADISAYKINRFNTPNIDRIGMQGVRFTDGYASAPVCGPSRAGLQTGRYQERFGFEYNNGPAGRDFREGYGLDVNEVTLGQLMKAQNYHTGVFGKWHLGSQDKFYPTNRGYDEFIGFLPGQTSYMDPDLPNVVLSTPDSPGNVDGPGDGAAKVQGKTHPKAFYRSKFEQIYDGPNHTVVHNEDQYLTDYLGDKDADFIQRNAHGGKPYFLYAAFNAVHEPLMVTRKYYDRFPNIKNKTQRVYAAMVASLDENVGKILDAVDKSGQADNTIIYFASDNGCASYVPGLCSCDPLRGGKLSHYEGGTRVPFMMRWPSHIKPGQVYRQVVSLLDILPTSVAAAGGQLPKDRVYDGVDIMPYIAQGRRGTPHDMLLWRRRPLISIRKGDWKLWESVNDETGKYGEYKLLFNLKNDLHEDTNLADKYPDKVKELEGLIHEWSKDMTDAKWPSRPPVTFSVCGTPFTLPI